MHPALLHWDKIPQPRKVCQQLGRDLGGVLKMEDVLDMTPLVQKSQDSFPQVLAARSVHVNEQNMEEGAGAAGVPLCVCLVLCWREALEKIQ